MAKKSLDMGQNLLKPQQSVLETMTPRKISAKFMGLAEDSLIGKSVDNLGKMVNLPTRFLMAEDEFFSQLAYRANIFTKLYTQAEDMFARGLLQGTNKEDAITQFIKDNFDKHFADTMSVHTGDIVRGARGINPRALNEAMEATWTKELPKGSFGRKVQDMATQHPAFKRIAPFVRTPLNIMSDTFQHTPILAQTTHAYKEAIAKGGRDAMLARSKMTLGGLVWATAIWQATSGNITGGGPRNAKAREALLETGWRPYSIRVGDKYISYNKIEPFGSILGIAGDYADIMGAMEADDDAANDPELMDQVTGIGSAMIFSLFKNLSSKSYTHGIAELLSAIDNPEGLAQSYGENFVLSYAVPAFLSQSRKIFDPEIKETKGLIEEFLSRVPGLSETLPTKYSWLTGKPVMMHGGSMAGFSPVLVDNSVPTTVTEELTKMPRAVLGPSKEIGGIKLDSEQVSDYYRLHGTVKIQGKTLMEAMDKLMQSREYDIERKVYPDTREVLSNKRYKLVSSLVQKYRNEAKKELYRLHPELRDAVLNRNRKDKAAGAALLRSRSRPNERETAYQKMQSDMKKRGF